MENTVWQLELGDKVIATFVERSFEFPWVAASLANASDFERFRDFFSDEDYWPETQEFEELCNEVVSMGRFSLRNNKTNEVFKNFRLNHDGENIWFRYS